MEVTNLHLLHRLCRDNRSEHNTFINEMLCSTDSHSNHNHYVMNNFLIPIGISLDTIPEKYVQYISTKSYVSYVAAKYAQCPFSKYLDIIAICHRLVYEHTDAYIDIVAKFYAHFHRKLDYHKFRIWLEEGTLEPKILLCIVLLYIILCCC